MVEAIVRSPRRKSMYDLVRKIDEKLKRHGEITPPEPLPAERDGIRHIQ